MTKHWNSIMRWAAPVLGAGLLLQAGGCSVNVSEIVQGVLASTFNNLITGFVYGAFNVPVSGFF